MATANNLNSLSPKLKTDEYVEYEKYVSLIHALKGQEEFLLDKNGIIVSSNLELVNITGYEEYEILGRNISVLYPHEEKNKAKADLDRALGLGKIVVSGLRLRKHGSSFWAKMKIESINSNDSKGLRPKFKVILQDTTYRVLSNLRVRTIKDEYLAVFNNPFVGSFKFRIHDYGMLMCNPKTLEIMNIKDESASCLYFSSFFHDDAQFDQFISLLKKERRVEGFKFLINDRTGSGHNWGVVSARYFLGKEFVEGVIFDISEQHTQAMELNRVNAELDNFIYHASHDFRSPLATILGLANLGMTEAANSKNSNYQYFKMIGERVNHLDVLLKNITSVSYNNNSEIKNCIFDFNEEIRNILTEIRQESVSQPQVELDISKKHPFATDANRMRTILKNLLLNSFKYYNPTVLSPYIKVSVGIDSSNASIQIQDNGIGIDWAHKSRVFEMFFKGTISSKGYGLGLYIAKSMIEKIGGKISLQSTLNEGTTFLLNVPNQMTLMDLQS